MIVIRIDVGGGITSINDIEAGFGVGGGGSFFVVFGGVVRGWGYAAYDVPFWGVTEGVCEEAFGFWGCGWCEEVGWGGDCYHCRASFDCFICESHEISCFYTYSSKYLE